MNLLFSYQSQHALLSSSGFVFESIDLNKGPEAISFNPIVEEVSGEVSREANKFRYLLKQVMIHAEAGKPVPSEIIKELIPVAELKMEDAGKEILDCELLKNNCEYFIQTKNKKANYLREKFLKILLFFPVLKTFYSDHPQVLETQNELKEAYLNLNTAYQETIPFNKNESLSGSPVSKPTIKKLFKWANSLDSLEESFTLPYNISTIEKGAFKD